MATSPWRHLHLHARPNAEWVVIVGLVAVLVVTVLAVRSSVSHDRALSLRSSTSTVPSPRPAADAVTRVKVDAVPDASGDVLVTEVVRAPAPLFSLNVRLPPPAALRGPGLRPRVVDLRVTVGDLSVRATIPAARGHATLELPGRGTEVRLTYVLQGATSRRRAAPEGRALVQVRPLSYDVQRGDGLVTTGVTGVVVHNLVCPELPVDDQLCGREGDTGWVTTPIPLRSSTVLAQVDLPVG